MLTAIIVNTGIMPSVLPAIPGREWDRIHKTLTTNLNSTHKLATQEEGSTRTTIASNGNSSSRQALRRKNGARRDSSGTNITSSIMHVAPIPLSSAAQLSAPRVFGRVGVALGQVGLMLTMITIRDARRTLIITHPRAEPRAATRGAQGGLGTGRGDELGTQLGPTRRPGGQRLGPRVARGHDCPTVAGGRGVSRGGTTFGRRPF